MTLLPVLQSGFVAFNEKGLCRPNPNSPVVMSSILHRGGRVKDARYVYSTSVTTLYKEYVSKPSLLQRFEFRERILKEVISLMGKNSFRSWVALQNQSPTCGPTHKEFLEDTFNYLMYGERRMPLVNWVPLLSAEEYAKGINLKVEDYFYTLDRLVKDKVLPNDLLDLLTVWLQHPDGFSDLLTTLYLWYGDRYVQFGVGDLE